MCVMCHFLTIPYVCLFVCLFVCLLACLFVCFMLCHMQVSRLEHDNGELIKCDLRRQHELSIYQSSGESTSLELLGLRTSVVDLQQDNSRLLQEHERSKTLAEQYQSVNVSLTAQLEGLHEVNTALNVKVASLEQAVKEACAQSVSAIVPYSQEIESLKAELAKVSDSVAAEKTSFAVLRSELESKV